MWIARQGVKAPLPKGWKAIHDVEQNELYYFNFDTGESIWDHPCDNDYKSLVMEQRKLLLEKGRKNYKAPESSTLRHTASRLNSPGDTLKGTGGGLNGTSKSTSTISDVINVNGKLSAGSAAAGGSQRQNLRSDFVLYDTRNVEFEEEDEAADFEADANARHQRRKSSNRDEEDEDEEEESEASWQKKSARAGGGGGAEGAGSADESSDDFQKPVDFGIDKETSMKLDKLNVMLTVGSNISKMEASTRLRRLRVTRSTVRLEIMFETF
jgi:hypothetical protein